VCSCSVFKPKVSTLLRLQLRSRVIQLHLFINNLRLDLCNGCTDLQLGRFQKLFIETYAIYRRSTTPLFISFFLFDFINKIEIFHSIHIKGR